MVNGELAALLLAVSRGGEGEVRELTLDCGDTFCSFHILMV